MRLMQTPWKWSDMNIKPIHTQQDYEAALKSVSPLFDNEPASDTPESDYLEVMITLIEAYEARHFPIEAATPIEAIKFRMEQSGMTAKDLEPAIGRVNRVYEILNGKRQLTLPMIRNLHRMFGIPVESLIGR